MVPPASQSQSGNPITGSVQVRNPVIPVLALGGTHAAFEALIGFVQSIGIVVDEAGGDAAVVDGGIVAVEIDETAKGGGAPKRMSCMMIL